MFSLLSSHIQTYNQDQQNQNLIIDKDDLQIQLKEPISPPYAMYILINNDLKMEKGKIAGQVGHIVQRIIEAILPTAIKIKNNELNINDLDDETKNIILSYEEWRKNGMAKIVLKATQPELEEIIKNYNVLYIRDLGLTQIPPNSLTVIGFYPALKSDMENIVKNFKLL
jgi:PTH2 family peptidyl-tRNA hydrolase